MAPGHRPQYSLDKVAVAEDSRFAIAERVVVMLWTAGHYRVVGKKLGESAADSLVDMVVAGRAVGSLRDTAAACMPMDIAAGRKLDIAVAGIVPVGRMAAWDK